MPAARTDRHAARTAVVWDALQRVLAGPEAAGGPAARILDIGGGTGGFAVRLAGLGHRVTVVDPSPDALAALARRAREAGVEVTGRQGDLGDLGALEDVDQVDLVLCHGVLEVAGDPALALDALRRVLRPGGSLSLLIAQRYAAVLARAMAGHFTQALSLLDPPGDAAVAPGRGGGRRFASTEIGDLLTAAGFQVDSIHGVRVFADLVPGSLLDLEPGAGAALAELEQAASGRPELLPLATQLHLLAH